MSPARDAAATRARILEAAVAEFVAHGLSGARIDRIAEAAGANKRSIYVYFESKEGLFAAALDRVIGEIVRTVELTDDDLPGYAGRIFDYYLDHPETLRMTLWRRLERPAEGPDEAAVYARKLAAMQHRTGDDELLPRADLMILINGMTAAWALFADGIVRAEGADPASAARRSQHRMALVEAVRRLSPPR